MATKTPIITDEEQQQRLDEAYQRLVDSLDQRKNRVFDPTWMAAAQAFATPSKTGSAFEAIGRVAGAVGKAQEAEQAQEQGIAQKMFDIERQRIELAQNKKLLDKAVNFGSGEPPAGGLPQAAPQPAPPSPLAAAAQAPVESGPVTPPVVKASPLSMEPVSANTPPLPPLAQAAAPQPPAAPPPAAPPPLQPPAAPPPASPLAAAAAPPAAPSGYQFSPKAQQVYYFALAKTGNPAEAIKAAVEYDKNVQGMEVARENLKVEQGKLAQGNIKTLQDGTVIDMSSGKPVPIWFPGGEKVNINGQTFLGDPVNIRRYYTALENNDVKESEKWARFLTQGRFGSPIAPPPVQAATALPAPAAPAPSAGPLTTAAAATKPTPVGESTQEAEARKRREQAEMESELETKKSVQIEKLKEEQKLQKSIVDSKPEVFEQKANAKKLIEIFSDEGIQQVLGPTAKPGLKAAVLEVASGGFNVAGNSVNIANLQKALVQAKATQDQINKLNVASSTIGKINLAAAKTFLSGQGPVSNNERELVAEINGSVYKDPASALLYKAQLAFAQADMKDRYIKTFQTWKDKHPDGTVEQFNRTDAYNQIESSYGKQLEKIGETIKLGKPATKTETKSETPMSTIRNKINSLLQ